MPIFEYRCTDCEHRFEALVRRELEPNACPHCGRGAIERLLSMPAVKSDGTQEKALASARRRDSALAKDRAHEQRKYELSHDD